MYRHLPPPPPMPPVRRVSRAGQASQPDQATFNVPGWLQPGNTLDTVATWGIWALFLSIGGVAVLASTLGKQQEQKRRQLGCWPSYGNRDCTGLI